MHQNLEKRFIRLATQQSAYRVAFEAFRIRYNLLFDAMAIELGWTRDYLGEYLWLGPVPKGGNAIMNGKAEASPEDVAKLLELYLTKVAK